MLAGLLCQAGMALVVKLGNIYRPVTLTSTAVMIIVACFTALILSVLYELLGTKGYVYYALSAFCLIVTIDSLLCPLKEVYYRYTALAAILAVLLAGIPIIFGKHERERYRVIKPGVTQENVFAIIALTAGIVAAVKLPVCSYNSWDDETHYHRLAYYSQAMYASETEAEIDLIYSPLIKPNSQEQIDFENRLNIEDETLNSIVSYSDPKAFFPDRIGYTGILVLTWLGRLLKVPFTVRYTMGRIGNLLAYVLIMYLAIKHLRRGKTLLAVLGLSTTAVYTAANFSYDPWVLAFSALSFSYFFTAIDSEKKLTVSEMIIMVGSLALAVMPKMPYAFLLLFLLLMPSSKFGSSNEKKWYRISIVVSFFVILALLYLSTFGTGMVADARYSDEPVSAVDQLILILKDPIAYIKLLLSFLVTYLNPAKFNLAFTAMGASANGNYLNIFLMTALFAAIYDSVSSKPYIRIGGVGVCIAMAAVLATVFYLIYTPVGKDYIAGCQERYLVPMMFPAFTLLFGGYIKLKKRYLILDYAPIISAAVVLILNFNSVLL